MSRWRDLNPRPLPYQGSALPLSYTGNDWSGRRGSNSRPLAWKANALPTELLPHLFILWAKMDSNHRRYKPADLQSAPFGHSVFALFSISSLLSDSNQRPRDYKSRARPTELKRHRDSVRKRCRDIADRNRVQSYRYFSIPPNFPDKN